MAIFRREKRDERRLHGMLTELGFGRYWQLSSATIPFELAEATHRVSIYRVKNEVHLWGLSRLIFQPGCVPGGVIRGVACRNAYLEEIRWTRSQHWEHEIFAVTVAKPIGRLNAGSLRALLMRTVEELERCRRILEVART